MPTKVIFVCLGNICRSPMAEAVFSHLVTQKGLEHEFEIFSAGTADYHVGDHPDRRTIEVCTKNGIAINHRGKQLDENDMGYYDYVVAMDLQNLQNIKRLAKTQKELDKIYMIRDFSEPTESLIVPDPYYGTIRDFEEVYKILNTSCEALLHHILQKTND